MSAAEEGKVFSDNLIRSVQHIMFLWKKGTFDDINQRSKGEIVFFPRKILQKGERVPPLMYMN